MHLRILVSVWWATIGVHVLSPAHAIKMFRIYAASVLATVVYFVTFWNWTYVNLIKIAMRAHRSAVECYPSISVTIGGTRPIPAPSFRVVNVVIGSP